MIGYITLGTADIKRGAEFYDAIGKEMDTPRMMGSEEDGFVAWRKPGDKAGLSIIHPHDGKAMSVGNGSMVALLSTDQTHVNGFTICPFRCTASVSYTHLTLPTIYSV